MILIFDPSLGSDNIGDEIIWEFTEKHLSGYLKNRHVVRIPTHYYPGRWGRKYIKNADKIIVAGSNLLGFRDLIRRQWNLSFLDMQTISQSQKLSLLGVGWQSYKTKMHQFNKYSLRKMLKSSGPHFVRDQYTQDMLVSIGVDNVQNSGCLSTWDLVNFQDDLNTRAKQNCVVFTLTNYDKNPQRDINLVKKLGSNYQKLTFWPQSYEDLKYWMSLKDDINAEVEIASGNLHSFKKILQRTDYDYVGTRLHAGILALNNNCRSIIYAIDNRAKEMGSDINLPVFHDLNDINLINFLDNKYHFNFKSRKLDIGKLF